MASFPARFFDIGPPTVTVDAVRPQPEPHSALRPRGYYPRLGAVALGHETLTTHQIGEHRGASLCVPSPTKPQPTRTAAAATRAVYGARRASKLCGVFASGRLANAHSGRRQEELLRVAARVRVEKLVVGRRSRAPRGEFPGASLQQSSCRVVPVPCREVNH